MDNNLIYENVKNDLSEEQVTEILKSMVEILNNPENSSKILAKKEEAGNDLIELMRNVFPMVVEIQAQALGNFGLLATKEGLKDFLLRVNELLDKNEMVTKYFYEIKHIYLPPYS